jgi:hypothetical protein
VVNVDVAIQNVILTGDKKLNESTKSAVMEIAKIAAEKEGTFA